MDRDVLDRGQSLTQAAEAGNGEELRREPRRAAEKPRRPADVQP